MNDLIVSNIERQNVLNNKYAIANIQNSLGITGMLFEEEYRFTKKMVADFYEVDERTIEHYIEQYADELSANGYILCKGKRLKDLKIQFGHVINVGSKTTQLGLFNFRAFLNIGMLLTESEKAKQVRSVILESFFLCWFGLMVLLVDGIIGFQSLVDYFGSYALVEIMLLLLVALPTLAVYIFVKE